MNLGVPKEIKPQESRVAITPAGVRELIAQNCTVNVQKSAGEFSHFSDEMYEQAGAKILPDAAAVYEKSDLIVKVKEPLPEEYTLIKSHHTVFTYFHFAASQSLTEAMQESKATCIAYETIQEGRQLPLLTPMSEVAGRLATQQGAKYLENAFGGAGVLMGGVPGTPPAEVLVLGGGVAGTQAALVAAGMGANVMILDTNLNRLRQLSEMMPANVQALFSSAAVIEKQIARCHLIIGTVLIPGDRAPKLITRAMLSKMQKGTVMVDVAIDQGGCFETTRVTTHENPTYIVDHILHYAVANMPGAVPQTSTQALTNATLAYAIDLANKGWENACKQDKHLAKGLNVVNGKVTHQSVADAFSLPHTPIEKVLI